MGGRSGSFRSKAGGGAIGTLNGTKEEIAEAEKIRQPYLKALKKLDNMKDTMVRDLNSDTLSKVYKGIRTARGETPEGAIAKHWAPWYYDTNDSVSKDISNIRSKNNFSDWDITSLGQKINSGKVSKQAGLAEAHSRMNKTNHDLYSFFKSEGQKALSHKDAKWWIKNKKNF